MARSGQMDRAIAGTHLPLANVMEEIMQPDRCGVTRRLTLLVVISLIFIAVAFTAASIARAEPATPTNVYWVTSNSNNAITTCAGAANDCSLRGAVQLANASGGADTIYISSSVTSIVLSTPITLTGGSITIQGNDSEAVTSLKTNGNFAALVLNSNNNVIRGFWITSNGSHAGTAQHGIVINGNNNNINHNSLSGLGGDGIYITGSPGNIIDSNLIGVQTLGGTQWATCVYYPNDQWGVELDGANNNTVSNNTIGCNGQDGIGIHGNAYNNTVTDNFLGVVNWGGHVPNVRAGIALWGGTVNNIGTQGHGNVIGANTYGVVLGFANVQDNTIAWNSIGVSGTLDISNTVDGVNLQQGTTGNWIENNDIAYNSYSGVAIVANSPSNFVYHNTIHHQGQSGIWIGDSSDNNVDVNWIGVQISNGHVLAGCSFANGNWGIRLDNASNNSIDANIIGCSGSDGVGLSGTGTYSNEIYANWIGVADNGARVPNALAGVALWGGPHNNQIGRVDYGNVIGVNGTYGVYLGDTNTATNTVQLNSIGISGTLNISNTLDGVAIVGGAHVNRVYTNTIEDNGHNGVWLSGAGTINNVLQANTIRRNLLAGVAIQSGASGNSIGPGPIALGNTISANVFDGVYISDNTTLYNAVSGNAIGTNGARNAVDPNGGNGVVLDNGTSGNAIGWTYVERNVIAGNKGNGVLIQNGAHDNWVRANDIGTNRDLPVMAAASNKPLGGGTDYAALPNGGGISIYNAYTNTIGGGNYDNFIGHNVHTGVYLSGAAHGNVIGSNLVRNNGDYGVLLDGGNTAYNIITRTQIFSNGLDGIGERNGAGFNVWSEVGLHDNGGLGIDKSANNDGQNIVNTPNLVFDSINRQAGVVHGHADASVLGTVIVELYRVAPDPSGSGEGSIFVGKTTTDASGSWTITDPTPVQANGCYTAFVTESQLVIPFSSSEFSANTCRVFLPLTLR
ncbi:MAG TPA: right-handed parallel beta-helix repeat-containing protein [Anaerolineae bacterium]|nr:right-handed parallel beta-helix repeat-containing protein [Anaerolineae bacterium]